MWTIKALGGEGVRRHPVELRVWDDGARGLRTDNGAKIAVIAGSEHELAGWGGLDGWAIGVALDWGMGYERAPDLSVPTREVTRVRALGADLPTVTL